MAYAIAGLLAGITTTVVGMGGGLLLLLALGLMAGPLAALAWTAPALLLGNLHRVWMYRNRVDWRITRALVRGALPGSVLGAVFAVGAPPLLLQAAMLAMTGLMVCQRGGWLKWRPGPGVITPASFANGAVCATTGGAGALTAPLLLAAGLSGEAWIATQSAGAVAMHAGRLAGYGMGGLVSLHGLAVSAGLAVALVLGNTMGGHIRRRIAAARKTQLELVAVLVCVALALFGVAGATSDDARAAPDLAAVDLGQTVGFRGPLPSRVIAGHVVGQAHLAGPAPGGNKICGGTPMRSNAVLAATLTAALCLPPLFGCGGPGAQRQADEEDEGLMEEADQGDAAAKATAKAPVAAKEAAPKVNPNKLPGESDDAAASRINEEGKALVKDGKYEQALLKFRTALELFPLSNAIFNIGSMLYTLKRHAEAYPYLEQTLKQPLAAEQRKVVLRYRGEVLKAVTPTHHLTQVKSNPPGAMMVLNSAPLPYPTPVQVLVPFGRAELLLSYPGFSEKKVIIESTSAKPPQAVSVRLARAVITAQAALRCPEGADVFVDGQIRGYEKVSLTLPAGKHMLRCGKGSASKAFERDITIVPGGAAAFDFHRDRR